MPLAIQYIVQHAPTAIGDLQALLDELKKSPEQAIVRAQANVIEAKAAKAKKEAKAAQPPQTQAVGLIKELTDLIRALSQFQDKKAEDAKAGDLSGAQQQIATISEKLRPLLREKLTAAEQEEKARGAAEAKQGLPTPPKKSGLLYNALIALTTIAPMNKLDDEGYPECYVTLVVPQEPFYTIAGHIYDLETITRDRTRRDLSPMREAYHPREKRKMRKKAQDLGLAILTPKQAATQSIKDLRIICAAPTVRGLLGANKLAYWGVYQLYIEACKTQNTDQARAAVIQNIREEAEQAKKPVHWLITFIFSDLKGLGLLSILAGIILLALFMNAGLPYIISGSALIFLGFVFAGKGLWEDLQKATNAISNVFFDLPLINEPFENSALYNRIVSACRNTPPRIYPPVHPDDVPEPEVNPAAAQRQATGSLMDPGFGPVMPGLPAVEGEDKAQHGLFEEHKVTHEGGHPALAQSLAPLVGARVPVRPKETAEERRAKLLQGRGNLGTRTTSATASAERSSSSSLRLEGGLTEIN